MKEDNSQPISKKVPTNEECIYNAVQISKLVGEPPSTIRVWANMYYDFLCVKKINGRMSYTKTSVNEFKFIQSLIRDKGYTHDMIKERIQQFGFTELQNIQQFDDNNFVNAVITALSVKNKEQLESYMAVLLKDSNEFKKIILEEIRNEVAETLSDTLDTKLDCLKTYLDNQEQRYIEHDRELIKTLRDSLNKKTEVKKHWWQFKK